MGKNKGKLPDMLTKEQLIRLFEAMDRPKCSIACFIAVSCGLRIREVCRLQPCDCDLERRTIKIRDSKNPNRAKNKGYGKDRIVPIPEMAVSPIKKWLEIIQGGKWLFPSMTSPDKHLRPKTLHEWFREARERSGLNQVDYVVQRKGQAPLTVYKFRFHSLRHFYAQYVYERTRDLYSVANLLGHEQITTTQIYAKVSDKTKRETVDFAFNTPIKTKIFEDNPINAMNYTIPEVAKREKTPIEILEQRFAKGEISAIDYQTALRLLKARKDYLKDEKEESSKVQEIEIEDNYKKK